MPSDGSSLALDNVLYSSYFTHGFHPRQPASTRLPETWQIWEDLLSEARLKLGRDTQLTLKGIPASAEWRLSIKEMPPLPTVAFHADRPNLMRARQVLTFLLHFYIHSSPKTLFPIRIPSSLSVPLHDVSRCVGLPPICTYSDTIYYNWSYPLHPKSPQDVRINSTFTQCPDESHFYLTQVLIEHCGADIMQSMRKVIDAVNSPLQSDLDAIPGYLERLGVIIDDINRILCNVRTGCEPSVFYNEVRPWLPGTKLIFDGITDCDESQEWIGSSAAQSSIIQALDAFLGIDELTHDVGVDYEAGNVQETGSYLTRMRMYIPADHRVILDSLSIFGRTLRYFIIRGSSPESPSPALVAYNSVINAMKRFRNAHIRIATLYIVNQPRQGAKPIGTGGTELIPFLKGVRDQTIRGLV